MNGGGNNQPTMGTNATMGLIDARRALLQRPQRGRLGMGEKRMTGQGTARQRANHNLACERAFQQRNLAVLASADALLHPPARPSMHALLRYSAAQRAQARGYAYHTHSVRAALGRLPAAHSVHLPPTGLTVSPWQGRHSRLYGSLPAVHVAGAGRADGGGERNEVEL